MSKKSFFLGVISALGIIFILALGMKSAGYTIEGPLRLSDFTSSVTQSGSADVLPPDCSVYLVGSGDRTACEDAQANVLFMSYMNLLETDRLSFNCRKLLVREQQKLCVKEKTEIPKGQKQKEIMKQFSDGGDITLCDNFSSEKLEQDRCRLDFVLDRLPHSISVTASGGTPKQRKLDMKECTLVEKYGLKEQCEQEKEMMKKFENKPIKNSIQ